MILAGSYISTWNSGSNEVITRCGVNIQTMSLVFTDVSNDDTEDLEHLDSEMVEIDILGDLIQLEADQGTLTDIGQQQLQAALEKHHIKFPPVQKSTALFVSEISVIDPDSLLPVAIAIYKDSCGGMFGIDSSYIDQEDIDSVPNLFNQHLAVNITLLQENDVKPLY